MSMFSLLRSRVVVHCKNGITRSSSSRVSAVSLSSADLSSSARFYADLTQLSLSGSPGVGRNDLWSPAGGGAGLSLLPVTSANEARITAIDPIMSIAVSNMRTALRQVIRRGGIVGKTDACNILTDSTK